MYDFCTETLAKYTHTHAETNIQHLTLHKIVYTIISTQSIYEMLIESNESERQQWRGRARDRARRSVWFPTTHSDENEMKFYENRIYHIMRRGEHSTRKTKPARRKNSNNNNGIYLAHDIVFGFSTIFRIEFEIVFRLLFLLFLLLLFFCTFDFGFWLQFSLCGDLMGGGYIQCANSGIPCFFL